MVSVSLAEILTIALVAVIVFGPRRLPEISRRAGRLIRDLKAAVTEIRTAFDADDSGGEAALDEVRRGLGPTIPGGEASPEQEAE